MEVKRNAYSLLVGKPEEMRRPRRRDDIKLDLREMGWGGRHWIDLDQDTDQWKAVVNTVMNLRVL
jgi:hypothetical protein